MTAFRRLCLTVPLVALLSACSPLTADQEPALVQCLTAKVSDSDAFEAGLTFATAGPSAQPVRPSRMSAWSCSGGWTYLSNPEAHPQVTAAYREAVHKLVPFKQGVYAAAAPARSSSQTQHRLGEVGAFMERVALARRDYLACHPADQAAVDTVAQLDETFVVAALGRYAGVDTVETARLTAVALAQRVQDAGQQVPPRECSADTDAKYLEDVKTFAKFYEGTHPWAPGCRVSSDADAFVLKCEAP